MRKLVYREDRLIQLPDNQPELYTVKRLNYLFQSIGVRDAAPNFRSYDQVPVYAYLVPIDLDGHIILNRFIFVSEDGDPEGGYTEWFRGGWVEPLYCRGCLQPSAIFDAISSCGEGFGFYRHKENRDAWVDVDEFQDMYEDAIGFWEPRFRFAFNGDASYWVTTINDDSGYSNMLSYTSAVVIFVVQPVAGNVAHSEYYLDKINLKLIEYNRANFISANDVKHLCQVDRDHAHLCPIALPFLKVIKESGPMWHDHIKSNR